MENSCNTATPHRNEASRFAWIWGGHALKDTLLKISASFEGLIRPKEEQDMVGFGLEEVFGIKLRKKEDTSPTIEHHPVFYATNRVCEGEDEQKGLIFGKNMDRDLHFGMTQVQCRQGKPQVKNEFQHVSSMSREELQTRLKEMISSDERKTVLVYVHGCFTDFARAMGYAAYIQRGLEFTGPIVVYSWPTVGRPSIKAGFGAIDLYRKDEVASIQSAPQLNELLEMLTADVGAKSIHVVSYSMGARTLLEALRTQHSDNKFANSEITSHLYFLAPDVAAHIFSKTMTEFRFPSSRKVAVTGNKECMSEDLADDELNRPKLESQDVIEGVHSMEEVGTSTEALHAVVDRLGDAWTGLVGDSVSALNAIRSAWKQTRENRWSDILNPLRRGADKSSEVVTAELPKNRKNTHVHLYVAKNDIALLISELLDSGAPQMRAGRRTDDMVLCNSNFNTIDATNLKTGLMTTGHFYLFHKIVREDMRHMLNGGTEPPWWRQGVQWNAHTYIKLRSSQPQSKDVPLHTQSTISDLHREAESSPSIWTSPIIWSSA